MENQNQEITKTQENKAIVTLTTTFHDPRNGEVTTKEVKGEGLIYGVYTGDSIDEDGDECTNMSVGFQGKMSEGTVMTMIRNYIRHAESSFPGFQHKLTMRLALEKIVESLGGLGGDDDDDDDDYADDDYADFDPDELDLDSEE